MNIDVCDARDPNPALSCTFERFDGEDTLYIPVVEANSLLEVEPLLRSVDSSVRSRARRVVFRLPPSVDASRFNDAFVPDLGLMQRRLEGVPFGFVAIEKLGMIPSLLHHSDGFAAERQDEYLGLLREAELRSLLLQPGVELPKVPLFHYEGPNGRHYPSFLRIGFALKNTRSVDAMLFWLSGRLRPDAPVIVDTGGLLPLAYALQIASKATTVRCLEGYEDALPPIPLRSASSANFLISVSSSGRMSERAKEEWRRRTGGELNVVSLYGYPQFVASAGDPILCQLQQQHNHYAPKDCPDCKKAKPSPAVRIDKNTYLLELTGAVVETRIKPEHASEPKAFFERYPNSGAVTLHRDQDGRHHMIHLDVGKLLDLSAFQERLAALVRHIKQADPVDFVLAPTHAVAGRFAKTVLKLLELGEDRLIIADKTDQLKAILDGGLNGRRCLLVDDVLITGHRLRTYKNHFRDLNISFDQGKFLFLVGVDRAPSAIDRQKIKDVLHHGLPYFAVEHLMLPFWRERECPWCREYDLIKSKMSAFSETVDLTTMRERFNVLDNKERGLSHGAFLPGVGGRPQHLGPTSLFGPPTMSDVEVFASVASTLQKLRDLGELSERRLMPVAHVLESQRTTEGRFYDTVITASLLRGCRDHDLRAYSQEERLTDEFRSRLREDGGAELCSEILLAVATGVLPVFEDLEEALTKIRKEQPGIAEFLAKISDRK